jgi:hypothetical protein
MRKSLVLSLLLATPAVSADTIFSNGFENPPDFCDHPMVTPPGWALRTKTWEDAFSVPGIPGAVYPNGVGSPVPVPGYEFFTRPQAGQFQFYTKGQIVAIPFTPLPDVTVDMTWDTAQAGANYITPRPAIAMFVGISPCKWDTRNDPFNASCWRVSGLDSLFYSTKLPYAPAVCPVQSSTEYFINVMMADPITGPNPATHTCQSTQNNTKYNGCDVQMRHTGN